MKDNTLFFLENPEVVEHLLEESGAPNETLRIGSYQLKKYYVSPGKMVFGLEAATVADPTLPRIILACPATMVESQDGLVVAMPLTSGGLISLYPGQMIFSSMETFEHAPAYSRMLSTRPQEMLQKCLPKDILQKLCERGRNLPPQVANPEVPEGPTYLQLELAFPSPTHAGTTTRQ